MPAWTRSHSKTPSVLALSGDKITAYLFDVGTAGDGVGRQGLRCRR